MSAEREGLSIPETFWERVAFEPMSGCWLWTGAESGDRMMYGYYCEPGGRTVRAHRFSYEAHTAHDPAGMYVCHRCDTPLCVNPDHLFLGTPADNYRDMRRKGRHAKGRGHGSAKLRRADVIEIRRSSESVCVLARRYGVDPKTVRKARDGVTWKHVGGQER